VCDLSEAATLGICDYPILIHVTKKQEALTHQHTHSHTPPTHAYGMDMYTIHIYIYTYTHQACSHNKQVHNACIYTNKHTNTHSVRNIHHTHIFHHTTDFITPHTDARHTLAHTHTHIYIHIHIHTLHTYTYIYTHTSAHRTFEQSAHMSVDEPRVFHQWRSFARS
jgi:hypothetical protein